MKAILFTLVTFFSISLDQEKMYIAVLELDAVDLSDQEAQVLTNHLRLELFITNKFNVFKCDKIAEILNEQGVQLNGCTTKEWALKQERMYQQQLNIQKGILSYYINRDRKSVLKLINTFNH